MTTLQRNILLGPADRDTIFEMTIPGSDVCVPELAAAE